MAIYRSWDRYEVTYRAKEMAILASWILSGESGSVVGLVGCGRSNLLAFLCHRPEALQAYLPAQLHPVVLAPVDLNDLPATNLSTLYRIILRSFYQIRDRFEPTIKQVIAECYQENRAERDPFLPQSALHELLLFFQSHQTQVVLVLNRFDSFCQITTPQMINTLRGLRDNFKGTLSYIVGMSQEVTYLPNPEALGDMYDILDSRVCWVGPMNDHDARQVIGRATQTASTPPTAAEINVMLTLAGNFPALLKAIGQWWLATLNKPPLTEWETVLLAERSIQHRLARMWTGLTQEEQRVLSEVQKLQTQAGHLKKNSSKKLDEAFQGLAKQYLPILERLVTKGLCLEANPGWQISGDLLVSYLGQVEGRGRGKIWLDQHGQIHQDQLVLTELTDLQRVVLTFLIQHPYQRHTKTDLIFNTWPDDLRQKGVSDEALYQIILELRRQIEPNPAQPRYLVTWRSKPEGGYQFFPEGRPG